MRIQTNMLAKRERLFLTWICPRLPSWVMPDHLTLLGIAGAAIVLLSQLASRSDRWFFWLASVGLLVHWFGDSLDGSVARFRQTTRPVYGYFVDHTVDAFCNLLIMVGFGSTLYIRMDVSLFALVGYYLLCMYVFITNHLRGSFQLSFVGMGPTELRILLILVNVGMFSFGRQDALVGRIALSYYDLLILLAAFVMIAIFIYNVVVEIRVLRAAPDQAAMTSRLPP